MMLTDTEVASMSPRDLAPATIDATDPNDATSIGRDVKIVLRNLNLCAAFVVCLIKRHNLKTFGSNENLKKWRVVTATSHRL